MIEQIKKLLEFQEADFAVDAAEKQVKSSKERKTANEMKQRFEIAVEERKKLIASRDDAEKELENLKASADSLLMNTVRKMVSGVFQTVQKTFDPDEEYDGAQVIKSVRAVLQRQAEEILESYD